MNNDLEKSAVSTSLVKYSTILLDLVGKHRCAAGLAITELIVYCSTSNEERLSQLSVYLTCTSNPMHNAKTDVSSLNARKHAR